MHANGHEAKACNAYRAAASANGTQEERSHQYQGDLVVSLVLNFIVFFA